MSTATGTQTFIKDKAYYSGTVKSQQLVYTGKEGEEIPTLILGVKIEGRLLNRFDPDKGIEPAPYAVEADVMLRFDPNGNMYSVLDDLEKLGFDDVDPEKLNPDAKKHHSFVDQKVFLSPSIKMKNDQEVVYWNFRFPKKFENKKLAKGEVGKSAGGQAFRELMEQRRGQRNAPSDGTPF